MIDSPTSVETALIAYHRLLLDADRWFEAAATALGPAMGCHAGCSACCRGLFDITLPDALMLQRGFFRLEKNHQQQILQTCLQRRDQLCRQWPELQPPYLLNGLQNRSWQIMPEHDPTPCPLLDRYGHCVVYEFRPLTCRLHGLPHIDHDGEMFSDSCCPYNEEAVCQSPRGVKTGPFRDLFTREAQLIRQVNLALTAKVYRELDTFIPLALLIDFADPKLWQNPVDILSLD